MPYLAFRGSDRPPHGLFSGVAEEDEEEEEVEEEAGPELSSTACLLFPFTCTAAAGRSCCRAELLSFCLCSCLRGCCRSAGGSSGSAFSSFGAGGRVEPESPSVPSTAAAESKGETQKESAFGQLVFEPLAQSELLAWRKEKQDGEAVISAVS